MVGRSTRDREVASSTPGVRPVHYSAFHPSGVGKSSTSLLAGVKAGAFTCVGWQVTLCDPIWQVTSRSSRTSSRRGLYSALTLTLMINIYENRKRGNFCVLSLVKPTKVS